MAAPRKSSARNQVEPVISLAGAELAYHILFDQMNEGAVTLTRDGVVADCNRRLAEIVRAPLEQVSNNVEVNWTGGNHFHLDKPLDAAECIDDPAISPEPPPAPFDTFIGDGTGRLNGVDGATIHFTFIDKGEPGGKNDMAAIRITDANGTVVLDVPLSVLTGGNVQAHYDQPHGSHAPH